MSRLQIKPYYFLFLMSLFFQSAIGQPYYFRHYQVDEGLSHNTVVSLLQARNGMIWIGTKGGLNSFDGHTFKSYLNRENSFGTIGNNFINSLCEDKKGMIWIGTGRGILRFNPMHETFFEIPSTNTSGVNNILVDDDNNIWFLKNSILCEFNQLKNRLTYFNNVTGTTMAFDQGGNLWIGNHKGQIYLFNQRQNRVEKSIQLLKRGLSENQKLISKLLILKDRILIGTSKNGLLAYHFQSKTTISILTKNDDSTEIYVRDMIIADGGKVWIGTESGIYVYNANTREAINLKKTPDNRYALSDNAVYCLLKDHEKGFWAGTFFGGLNYLSPQNIKFHKYISLKGFNSISGNAIREINSFDNENIWIGTEDAGLNKFNRITERFTHYTATGASNSLSYFNIHGILATKDKLYVGPFIHGLNIVDIKTGKILRKFPTISSGDKFTSDFVMSLYQTKDKRILVGTIHGGLFQFNEQNGSFTRMKFMPKNSNVYAILEDHEGTIWAGSLQNGIFYHNQQKGISGNIKFKSGNDFEHQIQGIFEDSQHAIWLATEGGGLIKIDKKRKTIKKLTIKDGLPSNYTFRILEDNEQNLWISSLKGLICLNINTGNIKVVTKANGLITDQFNYNSAYKDLDGNMYFGTVQGLVKFKPKDILVKTKAPHLYLTNFQINNTDINPTDKGQILSKSILYTDTVTLNYLQSNFNIEFATFSYSSPKTIQYQYMMQGIGTDDWTYIKNNQKAYFTDLAPGKYTFLVKAKDDIGDWESNTKKLVIFISPPFWKSITAYLIYISLIVFAFYLTANEYRKSLEAKNIRKLQLFEFEKDKEVYQAKIEFFTNIAHEIQTPLTLIRGPVERILDRIDEVPSIKKSIQMIEKNTNRLLSLTDQLLDFRKTEIDHFGLSFVKLNIVQVLKQEITVFKPEMERKKLKLDLKLSRTSLIAFVDYEAFTKIISNLLSNAIKYASTKIIIELLPISENDKQFIIVMSNDGNLISNDLREKIFEPFYRMSKNIDQPGTGIGLPIARSLAELHNGTLKLLPNEDNINIFELTLPVHHSIEFNLSKWKKM